MKKCKKCEEDEYGVCDDCYKIWLEDWMEGEVFPEEVKYWKKKYGIIRSLKKEK